MHSHKVDAFLSCSFRGEDADVVSFFTAIAESLDIRLVNVSNAATKVPPDQARQQIENSSLLIALCTKRDKLDSGKWVMPQAVQDEMSIAYGKSVPILMFVEKDVNAEGFKSNYGTYESFDRTKLYDIDFISKAVKSIHEAKLTALGDDGNVPITGLDDAVAEYVNHLVEMREDAEDYYWAYSTQKKLIYNQSSKRGFPSGIWPTVKSSCIESDREATWASEVIASSREIELIDQYEKRTKDCIELTLRPQPHPEKGDVLEYRTYATSRYINAVWAEELEEEMFVHLHDDDFECADGLLFIHRTKEAKIEFRFPKSYGLTKEEIHPFVGAYTNRVDYIVPSELDRANVEVSDFAGNVSITFHIQSPLPGHLYGIAWHPKNKPAETSDEESA